ncbi:MAG: hypothetical protein D8M58_18930 [Calditrichaeota bacterium]|nr:MAG: hypothetical protein DWQ03_21610 [Calditrichota bacterium]MBL1207485.1 hypothetical protein [Calditrichota bacterium]NOG47317.1 hypothetical protein [Calditrichota bacterium]
MKNVNKLVIVLLIGIQVIISCSEKSTKPDDAQNPEFISIRIDDRWNLNAVNSSLVEIKVSDPQGFSDLKNIAVKVFDNTSQMVFEDSLYDDGNLSGSTDLIAGDGVFRNVFLPSAITSSAGTFSFEFEIVDMSENDAGELKKEVSFGFNEAPLIESITVPLQFLSGANPEIISVVAPDNDGDNLQTKVFLDLLRSSQSVLSQPIQLSNNGDFGISGDAFAGDSIFSFKMDSSFAAGKSGDYKMEFLAEDEFSDKSEAVTRDIFIENKAGVILSATLPDTINRPGQVNAFTETLLSIKVYEPQGLTDIDSVYFEFIFPDGQPANNNPFLMVDNGLPFNIGNLFVEAGDKTANDGIFSLTFLVNDANQTGTYHFSFYMRDKVGNLTTALTDSIEVQ